MTIVETTTFGHTMEIVDQISRNCDSDPEHNIQVTNLALAFFDALHGLHNFGQNERQLLEIASRMHDIGWSKTMLKRHHKLSGSMIQKMDIPGLLPREKLACALIARYHTKAIPDISKHPKFASLSAKMRNVVEWLAGILRVADALDSSHNSVIKRVKLQISERTLAVQLETDGECWDENQAGAAKRGAPGEESREVHGIPMLIACLSDVHGNLPALRAAVADAKTRGATEFFCAGDIIGYGPYPNQVCDYLAQNEIASISGNYDVKALDVIKCGESSVSAMQKKKRQILVWTASKLGKSSRGYLAKLPACIRQTLPSGELLLVVHGSPVSDDDPIYPSITSEGLQAKLGNERPAILICGHSHIPFVKRMGGLLIVNCGSCGHPVDGDPRPSYALLSIDENGAHGSIVRFEYDVDEILKALKKTSLPKGLQRDFVEGTKSRFLQ